MCGHRFYDSFCTTHGFNVTGVLGCIGLKAHQLSPTAQLSFLIIQYSVQSTSFSLFQSDEYDGLICIKLAIKGADEGVAKLLSYPGSLESLILEIISSFVKIRIVTLEVGGANIDSH